ncbi:DinB family protein [Granulicella arctica]|uniref:Putative damage-inducible protein DinB n=1 Tax=Granulicella arctica TaxID=940613 RepID=A0A7Y9THJ5_9BACT|nr:DinB family protein [Granulicella arctica]NYF81146.1 putative damage-inducible protein DinB [Granulicella arctica]
MTIAEILLQDFDIEISNTRRTLERVPEDQNDFKCHDKSMPLGKLAMHCATLPLFGYYIVEDEGMDMAAPKRPHIPLVFTTREAALQQLDEAAAKCRASLAAASDEHLSAPWKFSYGEMLISNVPRSLTFRQLFFNHMVHHTAQLGVYLRLNDIPVPALYGPSADEQWTPPTK